MIKETFNGQIEVAVDHLQALAGCVAALPSEQQQPIVKSMANLTAALDDLSRAGQELRRQNEALAVTCDVSDANRLCYRDLFELAPDAYLLTDPQGIIRESNRAAATLFRVNPSFLVGKPLLAFVTAQEHETFHAQLTLLQKNGVDGDRVEDWALVLRAYDGTPFPASLTVGLVHNTDGQPTSLGWFLRDVTVHKGVAEALRESEARLHTVIANVPIFLFTLDPAGVITLFEGKGLEAMTREPGRFVGRSILDTRMPIVPQIGEDFSRALAGETFTVVREAQGLIFEIVYFPHENEQGRVASVIGVATNITERKRGEAALHRYADEQTALYETALRLNAQLEMPELLRLIIEQAVALLGAEMGEVDLYNPQSDVLTTAIAVGSLTDYASNAMKPGAGVVGQVFQSRHSLVVDHYGARSGSPAPVANELRFKAMLAVPLLGNHATLGVLAVGGGEKKPAFDEHDVRLAELFAAQATVALENAGLYAEVQHHARELAALTTASQAVVSVLDRDTVLKVVIAEIRELLDAEGASVLLRDDDHLVFAAADSPGVHQLVGMRFSLDVGIAGWVARERQAVRIGEAYRDPHFYEGVDANIGLTTRSLLAVPLVVKDAVTGVIEVVNKLGGEFTASDLEALESMAGSAAVAIENARLFETERAGRERLEMLYRIGQAINSTLDDEAILDRLTDEAMHATSATHGSALVVRHDLNCFERRSLRGYSPELIEAACSSPLPLEQGLNGRAYRTRQVICVDDVLADPEYYTLVPGTRTELVAPIIRGDQVLGNLDLQSPEVDAFRNVDMGFLQALIDQVAIALENARLYRAEREQRRLIEQSRAQLVRGERLSAIGRLAASVAHEINNPLQSVIGCLGLAREALDEGEDASQYLQIAREELRRIARIVARMRDLYRPESGEKKIAEVNGLVEQVLELSRKRCQESGVEIDWQPFTPLPSVPLAPDQIKQVFLNLLLNAVDAMPRGGRLQVTTAYTDAPPGVRIRFSDTGVGISTDTLPHIFEAFYSTKPDGTGLGLFISHDILEQSGGRLEVESDIGHGSTFTVWLPAK